MLYNRPTPTAGRTVGQAIFNMKTETIVLCIVVLAAHSMLVLGDCEFDGKILKAGESISRPNSCVEYTCQPDGAITGKGCPAIAAMPNCKIIMESSKPYPDCCPYFDCDVLLKS